MANMSHLTLLYKLIQCLHHLSLMRFQESGRVSKAFTLKLSHLNDFIKPANCTAKIRYHVDQVNKAWVIGITKVLVYHYEASVSSFINTINDLQLRPCEMEELVSKTVEKALKRFGKKLTAETIKEFKKILLQGPKERRQTAGHKTSSRVLLQQKKTQRTRADRSGIRSVIGAQDPLSNFFLCNFIFRGRNFRSLEHAYQWEKALFFGFGGIARKIENARTAAQAKLIAREIPYSGNWHKVSVSLMRELLRLKWEQVLVFREELKGCTNKTITHPVSDTFWGTGTEKRKGKNVFGELLQDLLHMPKRAVKRTDEGRKRGEVGRSRKAAERPVGTSNRFSALSENASTAQEGNKKRTERSAWSKVCRTSSPLPAEDYPEIPKPQRVRRTTRKVLNLTGIQTVPTPLKRGPPTPGSETEEDTSSSSSPPHNKTIGVCAKGSHPALVRTHSTDKSSKKKWTWPKAVKSTLVIGEGNLSRMTVSPITDVQLESYPGARFQHFTDMLKGKDFAADGKSPANIVIALGLNDRSSDPQKTSVRNLKTMLTWVKKRFESSRVFLIEMNFSKYLPIAEQNNLDLINRSLGHCDWATVIPKLQTQRFKIDTNDPTGIFWREDTANGMLNHWLNFLN